MIFNQIGVDRPRIYGSNSGASTSTFETETNRNETNEYFNIFDWVQSQDLGQVKKRKKNKQMKINKINKIEMPNATLEKIK